ncbi:MAG TPA: hypothetical protein PK328_03560 [Chitinophagaceae bacterium]|nr:hypothetical protein [Chitinophagaceae bacterium]
MSDILSQWFVEVEGSYFFKILYEKQKGHLDKSNFIDKTGFECFVNSFHVDDYTSKEFLEQSLLFAQLVFEKWLITNKELILKCIISETNTGVNIRFHIQRTNENWILDNDLENFEEGVFIMTSK